MWMVRSAIELSYARRPLWKSGVQGRLAVGLDRGGSRGRTMAQIEVGAAIGSGFGLIRRRPLSVLTWGLLPTALQGAVIALLAPMYLAMFGSILHSAQSGGAAPPDTSAFVPQMMGAYGLAQLLNLVQLLLSAVIYCAVFRAVLHPEKAGFAFLRVGAPELLLAVMIFGGVILLVVLMVLLMIPVFIIVAILAAASHGSAAGVALTIPLFILLMFVVMIFVGLRFSFVGPMMVDDGKFHLFESWQLTRGKVGSLFLIMLALIGIALAAEIVIVALMFGIGTAALAAVTGGFQNLPAFFQQPPAELLNRLAPFLAVYLLLFIPISGCAVAIFGAPFASAYRDLKPDQSEAFA